MKSPPYPPPTPLPQPKLRKQIVLQATNPSRFSPRLAFGLWAALLLVVVIGELLPGHSRPIQLLAETYVSDKLIHFGAYAVLSFIPAYLFPRHSAWKYLLATELVGCLLEVGQLFVQDRSCDIYDLIANTAGVVAGAALGMIIRSRILRDSPLRPG